MIYIYIFHIYYYISYYFLFFFLLNYTFIEIIIINITVMAADSDGDLIETVVTCEGDLGDPEFPEKLNTIVDSLKSLLSKGKFD